MEATQHHEYHPIKIIDSTAIVMKQSLVRETFMTAANDTPELGYTKTIAQIDIVKKADPEGKLRLFLNGADNLFPNNLKKILKRSPIYKVGLQYSAQQLMGLGLQKGKVVIENQEEFFVPVPNPAWDVFEKRSRFITDYYIPACKAIKTNYQVYVLITLSAKKLIAKVSVLHDDRCRVIGDPNTGEELFCTVTQWDSYATNNDDKKTKTYPLIDAWYSPTESLQELIKQYPNENSFVLRLKMPSDNVIYALPEHFSIVESGLIDYANNIVNFKSWIMQNMTTLNQILFISREYLETQHPLWTSWEDQAKAGGEKGKKAQEEMDKIYNSLIQDFTNANSGIKKGGKMIIAPMMNDGEKNFESVKVVKVEQNTFDAQYNADAAWVEKQILWAIQIDAGQYTAQEGKNNNGSSSKNSSFNIAQMNEWMFEQFIMEVPTFVSDFNGYGVELFRTRRATILTSDAFSAQNRQIQNPM